MYASIALFALSGVFAAIDDGPKWLNDYHLARKQSASENKPLAVFVGSGREGWNKVSREGELAKDVQRLLSQKYVCVYINRMENEGWKLAHAFELTAGPGLIISNRAGQLQAFRHEGDLETADMERYLARYADPDRVVTQTETYPQRRVSNYYDPSNGNGAQSVGTVGRSC